MNWTRGVVLLSVEHFTDDWDASFGLTMSADGAEGPVLNLLELVQVQRKYSEPENQFTATCWNGSQRSRSDSYAGAHSPSLFGRLAEPGALLPLAGQKRTRMGNVLLSARG